MEDYEQMSQDNLNNELKVATLLRCCPQNLRRHLELTMGKNTTYQGIRDAMTTYEQTTSSWTTTKVLKQVQTYNNSVKADPVEVDRIEKWKGKGSKGNANGKGKEPKGKRKQTRECHNCGRVGHHS